MKRTILGILFLSVAALSMAQAPFTIVRPADGSKVREKVHILIPKGSIPEGGYLGVYFGDKFIEAAIPPTTNKYYDYVLDTKGRGIPDGKLKLELVLYVEYSDGPKVVDRSSVDLIIANKADIKVPANGLKLKYNFKTGKNYVYNFQQRVTNESVSEEQGKAGGRGTETGNRVERLRLEYAVQNAYGNGDGLVRITALPQKGKTSAFIASLNDPIGKVYREDQLQSVYMRVASNGMEMFGALPAYVNFDGSVSNMDQDYNRSIYPLPSLPSKGVKPGSIWQARFQQPNFDINKRFTTQKLVTSVPMRGELVGLEWEMGHPCAKIRQSFSTEGEERMNINETIWFALDKNAVLKVIRTISMEKKVTVANPYNQGTQGGGIDPNTGLAAGIDPATGLPFGMDPNAIPPEQLELLRQQYATGGLGGGQPQRSAAPPTTQLQRFKIEQTFILEG